MLSISCEQGKKTTCLKPLALPLYEAIWHSKLNTVRLYNDLVLESRAG
jgi:hypothetical protein